MATRKTNAELPDIERARLLELRADPDQRKLHERVVALRRKKWPLRAIGEAIGVSRMSVHVWEAQVNENPDALARVDKIDDVPDLPLYARGSGAVLRKVKVGIPPEDQEKLAELAQKARAVRRWSPPDSPERLASAELDTLVMKYADRRGVTMMDIARYAGVTRRAIVARVERIHEREDATA